MTFPRFRSPIVLLLAAAGSLSCAAQEAKPAPPPVAAETKAAEKEAPLPADAHVAQNMQLDGKPLHYTATVGTLPVYDQDGKKIGEVVFTAYTVEGEDRPVTFALNGGPGAASVYLNLGAIGPKHIEFGDGGRQPLRSGDVDGQSRHVAGFTDLVFIDPIGTGFSRSLVTAGRDARSSFTAPTPTFTTSRGSSTTGW